MKIKGVIEIPVEIDVRNSDDKLTQIEYSSNIDELIENSVLNVLSKNNIKVKGKVDRWYNFPFPSNFNNN